MLCSRIDFRLAVKQVASRVIFRGKTISFTVHYTLSGRTAIAITDAAEAANPSILTVTFSL